MLFIDCRWRQFKFSVGAPDAEAKFNTAVKAASDKDNNATKYPVLYVRSTLSSPRALINLLS